MSRQKARRAQRNRPAVTVDSDAESRMSDAIGCSYIDPATTVYVLDFGDDIATAFYQNLEASGPPDDDAGPWFTGLYIDPDGFDLTEEWGEAADLGPQRRTLNHRLLFRELNALGRQWAEENDTYVETGIISGRGTREMQLRGLFERFTPHHPSRVVTGAQLSGSHRPPAPRTDGNP